MTALQGHRRPAVWALLAITCSALVAGLTTGTALADPDPASGKLVLVLDSSGSMKEPAGDHEVQAVRRGDGQTKIAAAQRTIVLVSDGEATCAPDPGAVAQSIAKQGIDLKIDVVGFRVGGKARTQLQRVAREGAGWRVHAWCADQAWSRQGRHDQRDPLPEPRGPGSDRVNCQHTVMKVACTASSANP